VDDVPMMALAWFHCVTLMLVLDPVTLNTATVDGFELVANARLSPEQLPAVDQLNVCGNVTDAPDEGLLSVAVQAAFALPTAPTTATEDITRGKSMRWTIRPIVEITAGLWRTLCVSTVPPYRHSVSRRPFALKKAATKGASSWGRPEPPRGFCRFPYPQAQARRFEKMEAVRRAPT
jgi:hypothetical protein